VAPQFESPEPSTAGARCMLVSSHLYTAEDFAGIDGGRSELMISEHNTDHTYRSQRRPSLPIVAMLGWLVLIAVSMSAPTTLTIALSREESSAPIAVATATPAVTSTATSTLVCEDPHPTCVPPPLDRQP
jgi:hypothetical protein